MPTDDVRDPADAPALPAAEAVGRRVHELIERGLEKYGGGDLNGALDEWEHALSLDTGSRRAIEYIDYVKQNYDALERTFAASRAAAAEAAAIGVPVPEEPEEVSGAYDLIKLEEESRPRRKAISVPPILSAIDQGWREASGPRPLPPPPLPPPVAHEPGASLEDDLAAVSAGLEMVTPRGSFDLGVDEFLTPPPPEMPTERSAEEITVPGGDEPPPLPERPAFHRDALQAGTNPGELPAPPGAASPPELDLELGGLDAPVPDDRAPDEPIDDDRGMIEAAGEVNMVAEPPPPSLPLGGDDTGEATSPAGMRRSIDLIPDEPADAIGVDAPAVDPIGAYAPIVEFDDDDEFGSAPQTRDRGPRNPPPPEAAAGVIIDEQLLRAYDDVSKEEDAFGEVDLESTHELLPNPRASLSQASPEHIRLHARISELIALAREALERQDFRAAVEAAEAAGGEDPDGKVAPVILHRHRDLLFRIYEGHIGSMTQVPALAVPLHQISAEDLDHRTGFLLSRIDGMLTYEDILDVAGMPRMEAYKILSTLLRKGFIEVRTG